LELASYLVLWYNTTDDGTVHQPFTDFVKASATEEMYCTFSLNSVHPQN